VNTEGTLARRLTATDATVIGLGSMIGAGVFAAVAPAAQAAGGWLLAGLVIAAGVAWCNAAASAQLAAVYPVAGGTYTYARERLGPWWGFSAGWSFLVGKTASCAAMALVFAAYVAPQGWEKPVAVLAIVALSAINLVGVTRTALAAKLMVTFVIVVLVGVLIVVGTAQPATDDLGLLFAETSPYGILQSAGILFFAFAGYARIATLGEEVKDPARSIPRAIMTALLLTAVLYSLLAAAMLAVLGTDVLAASTAPIADLLVAVGWGRASGVVSFAAAIASLGALLALMAGIGRTTLAMARVSDLPSWFGAISPRFSVPYRAELVLSAVLIGVVLVADLRGAIAFSSFGVLLYYFIANLSAFTQPAEQRRIPRMVNIVGALACLALIVTVPFVGVAVGLLVVALGIPVRLLSNRQSPAVPNLGA